MANQDPNKLKVLEPETIKDIELPILPQWEGIINRPTSLSDLDQTAQDDIDSATATFLTLGNLAYLNSITTTEITDNSVTTPKIFAGAVTASKIQAGTITANEVATNTLTANEIDTTTITTLNLTAGTIVGLTITGGTVQTTTSSSGRRIVLDGTSNQLRFIYSGGNAGIVVPIFSASGKGIGIETSTAESYIYLNEGSISSITIGVNDGIGVASLYIDGGNVDISGIVNFSDHVYFNNRNLYNCGNIRANDTTSDIGLNTIYFDNLYIKTVNMKGGLLNISAISGKTAGGLTSSNGSMYYRTDDNVIRVKIGGVWKTVQVV